MLPASGKYLCSIASVTWVSVFYCQRQVNVCVLLPVSGECLCSITNVRWMFVFYGKGRVSVCVQLQASSECLCSIASVRWMFVFYCKCQVNVCVLTQVNVCIRWVCSIASVRRVGSTARVRWMCVCVPRTHARTHTFMLNSKRHVWMPWPLRQSQLTE